MLNPEDCMLYSGGARGAEATFGAVAEQWGIEEVNFTFDGHGIERTRGIRVLNHEELLNGDVSLTYVSRLMHRDFPRTPVFRKLIQTIWYQINSGQEIYVVGTILDDDTVRGGTGWGAEFAKICNKPLYVFDQDKDSWFVWGKDHWVQSGVPLISHTRITGTGTRTLHANGRDAIVELFARSFVK